MSNNIGKILFWIFIFIGIISFILMFLSLFNPSILNYLSINTNSYDFLPATFILLSSLIAAFSVNRTIINTEKNRLIDKSIEEERTKKIISVAKKFFLIENEIQQEFFEELKNNRDLNDTLNLNSLPSIEYFYNEKINENKIINQINYCLNSELHKHSSEDLLAILFEIKNDILLIMHYVNVLKSHIVNDKKSEFDLTLKFIFGKLDEMKENVNKL